MPSFQCCCCTPTADELLGFPITHSTRHELQDMQTQKRISEVLSGHPTLKSFLSGSISGTVSTVLFQPFDLVKTRLQNASIAAHPSNVATIRFVPLVTQVLKNEQILGLWRGTVPRPEKGASLISVGISPAMRPRGPSLTYVCLRACLRRVLMTVTGMRIKPENERDMTPKHSACTADGWH
ncbi:unnamed protein product [Medioppia subpectinata]|uniref:Mitochondrial carrier protein n=1 Tax=Medioppia subpectinata TaxID=1979941 RepID=A0A7R9L2G0_9ACAR|nr:unnamed protein product [Medioppia subpectinata]CAG2114063.1 unnamed protein product [Medioppia subpectinata]